MFNPDTILIPVEIDVDNFHWLSTALQFSRRVTADVYIFFVNDAQAGYRHPAIDAEELEEKVRVHLDSKELTGLSVKFVVAKGDVSKCVKEFCNENNIDMIATGHKHHSRIYGSLFDTQDEGIIDAVEIPVLVIPK
jgi:nucleotide-binding universal stress UspA family protein